MKDIAKQQSERQSPATDSPGRYDLKTSKRTTISVLKNIFLTSTVLLVAFSCFVLCCGASDCLKNSSSIALIFAENVIRSTGQYLLIVAVTGLFTYYKNAPAERGNAIKKLLALSLKMWGVIIALIGLGLLRVLTM